MFHPYADREAPRFHEIPPQMAQRVVDAAFAEGHKHQGQSEHKILIFQTFLEKSQEKFATSVSTSTRKPA